MINFCVLLFKLVRELYKEPFATFTTIWHHQVQDVVFHGGQKVTSQRLNYRKICVYLWVAHLVDALHYNPKGRGFESPWGCWDFSFINNSGFAIALGIFQTLMKRCTRHMSWGLRVCLGRYNWFVSRHADFLQNLEDSISWNPMGLSSPVPYWRVQNSCLSPSIHTSFVKQAASFWSLRQN
jgi:hypothetical protein